MKKSISIHEVPEILQELIYNTAGRNLSKHSYALPYLNKIEWTKCSDAERLAYCEVRYPKGTKVKSCVGTIGEVGDKIVIYDNGAGGIKAENAYTKSDFLILYSGVNGKFAEIISDEVKEPSIKEKLKGTCVLNKKEGMGAEIVKLYTEAGIENIWHYEGDMTDIHYGEKDGRIITKRYASDFDSVLTLDQLRSIVRGEKAESVEFKEGEMVEHKFINSDWIADGIIFTGGRTSQGLFVCEDKHGMLRCVEQIRKIDPDPHGFLKTANEIISERIQHKPFDEDSVRDMLIEAMKRVKKVKL